MTLQPFTWLLHDRGGSGSQDILPQSLVKKYFLLSPLISSLPASLAACDWLWWCNPSGQPSTNTAACFSLCTPSFQMHVAKTNPILSPLRDTVFMEPPASGSLAQLPGTSQARACSEGSSARAESVRAIEKCGFSGWIRAGSAGGGPGTSGASGTSSTVSCLDAATAPAQLGSHPGML